MKMVNNFNRSLFYLMNFVILCASLVISQLSCVC
nr:MAG TPA: hypothetical protein [Caudoviricetes sp.]